MNEELEEGTTRGWRDSLDFHIPQVGNRMHNVYNRAFRRLGVTRSQAVALVYLAEYGTLSQTRLARLVGLGKAATGTLLQQMEQAELIIRQPDPDDGRNRLVRLGPPGADLIERFSTIGHEIAVTLRRNITPAERRLVADVLRRMQLNLDALDDEPLGVEWDGDDNDSQADESPNGSVPSRP